MQDWSGSSPALRWFRRRISWIRLLPLRLALLGLLEHFGYAHLPGDLGVLGNWWVIGSGGVFVPCRLLVDKSGWVDSAWGWRRTPSSRIPRGAAGRAGVRRLPGPATVIGGFSAGGSWRRRWDGTKALAVRVAVNTSPEPVSNIVVSNMLEDVIGMDCGRRCWCGSRRRCSCCRRVRVSRVGGGGWRRRFCGQCADCSAACRAVTRVVTAGGERTRRVRSRKNEITWSNATADAEELETSGYDGPRSQYGVDWLIAARSRERFAASPGEPLSWATWTKPKLPCAAQLLDST